MSVPEVRPRRARLLLPALAGAVAALIALGLIPASTHALGPASVSAKGSLGPATTTLQVPPFGTIAADTHLAPIAFDLAFDAVDFEALGPLATTSAGRAELSATVEADLRGLVVRVVIQSVLGAALLGALVAGLIWHRQWRHILAAALGGSLLIGALLALSAITFEVESFEEPSYTGTIARAPQVIDTVRDRVEVLDDLRSRYETATRRISNLLLLMAEPDEDPRQDATAILHVSDIHANPLGIDIAAELAREFDVAAIIDSGDLASSFLDTGEVSSIAQPLDRRLGRAINGIGVPYLFVAGNHDSYVLRSTMSGFSNITVLDGDVVTIEGIDILGWADPTFSTEAIPKTAKSQTRLDTAPEVAAAVDRLGPDILVVHDEALAADSFGRVALILAGHFHSRDQRVENGTLLLRVGSTGATGLKSLTLESDQDYEAEVVYFRGGRAVAVDYIRFKSVGGDFVVERRTLPELEPSLSSRPGTSHSSSPAS